MKKAISLLLALLLLCALLPNSLPQAQAAEAGYDLYVYGVQVTESNKNDIFQNGGSFCYDPVRNELTIGHFTASEHDLVENHIDGLTVWIPEGWDNEQDDLIATNGHSLIKSSCDIRIRTKAAFKAPRLSTDGQAPVFAVAGNSTLTIDHAVLEIKGGSAAISGADDPAETQTLILRTSYLKIDGVQAAVQKMRGGVSLDNSGIYDAGEAEAVYFRDGALTDADGAVLQTICFAPTVAAWDLMVDGVIVYEDNRDDILEDGGSARFDPDTQTLTLNNPVMHQRYGRLIQSGLGNLTICGRGTIISDDFIAIYGLNEQSLITLDGDFTIGTRKKDMLDVPAIYTAGILCFGGGHINVIGNENGVEAEEGILFSGGTVEIRCSLQAVITGRDGCIGFTNGMTILEPVGAENWKGGWGGYYIGDGWTIGTDRGRAAKLKVGTEPRNPFVDVDKNASCYNAVLWAVNHKPYQVTAGMDATHFGPDRTVTRAQAMTFFWAAQDRPKFKNASTRFVDVKKTDWYYKPVMWAVENGITVGTDDTHFSPNKTCNRGEILTFFYAAMGKPKVTTQNPYIDVTNQWYKKAALWAFEQGIEQGENAKFNASTPCTRASTVTYLYRFLTGYGLTESIEITVWNTSPFYQFTESTMSNTVIGRSYTVTATVSGSNTPQFHTDNPAVLHISEPTVEKSDDNKSTRYSTVITVIGAGDAQLYVKLCGAVKKTWNVHATNARMDTSDSTEDLIPIDAAPQVMSWWINRGPLPLVQHLGNTDDLYVKIKGPELPVLIVDDPSVVSISQTSAEIHEDRNVYEYWYKLTPLRSGVCTVTCIFRGSEAFTVPIVVR